MKKLLFSLSLIILSAFSSLAISADQILAKAASVFSKAGSVSATYTISSKGAGQTKGSIKAEGKKFCIETPQMMVCYNGTNQWEYVAQSKQCTLTAPTYQETAQINPYTFLNTYKSSFKASTEKSNINGTYAVRLVPVSGKSAISKAVIYIKSSDWQPVRLDVLDKTGNLTSIVITGISLGQKFPDSTFTFDKKKYPKVELIDLR